MGLNQSQRSIIEKARSVGASELAVALSDEVCAYLVGIIVRDLGYIAKFPEMLTDFPDFYFSGDLDTLILPGIDFLKLLERLAAFDADAITYFSCLAALHKARLKYLRILKSQPLPTMDQVGPRGLLQFGAMSPRALTGFILWRKWIYDIDNRAAQETGYLFEPIIAHSIGGVPVSSAKSPIRRHRDPKKGRQVDCIRDKKAYEFKIRVTIAASGQGRWQEELDFPLDCRTSGYRPVLVVFDPTENPKLAALVRAFLAQQGEVYIGDAAWTHLGNAAGGTMSKFLENYVRIPIQSLLAEYVNSKFPDLQLKMDESHLVINVNGEEYAVERIRSGVTSDDNERELFEDIDDEVPGP